MDDKIFISYSRKDQPFVHRLNSRLQREGLTVWGDWEALPLSGDWWQEVQKRIEKATLFICVISPASANSRLCHQDINHALTHNKRIIPILRREPEEPYHPLEHLHWIFFRESDNFERSFEILTKLIRAGLSWEEGHCPAHQANGGWKSG